MASHTAMQAMGDTSLSHGSAPDSSNMQPSANLASVHAYSASLALGLDLNNEGYAVKAPSPVSHTTSSLRSSQELHDTDTSASIAELSRSEPYSSEHKLQQEPCADGGPSPPSGVSGQKRTASGQVKQKQHVPAALDLSNTSRHITSPPRTANSASVTDLSQQLRTRLTYAMVKVQNGWQNRSLDEVESLASQSPRSAAGFTNPWPVLQAQSPRTAIAATFNREYSTSSSGSDSVAKTVQSEPYMHSQYAVTSPTSRRALAPPANIISGQRRRPTPNMAASTVVSNANRTTRPAVSQRTPSQTARYEADAVETLLFMASPNNSGNASQFSPATNKGSSLNFSSQTSPLRNTFSEPTSPRRVTFTSDAAYASRYGRDKNAMIESLVERLDEDSNADLDEAIQLMDRHHAAKLVA